MPPAFTADFRPGFAVRLIAWYQRNHRDLPWRHTTDPYSIWLSEVILQQTRVKQGLPYYQAFLRTFPTVHALAAASEQEVLRLWQGLGYYSRARNLHRTARQIVDEFGGVFPNSYAGLLQLRGIGPYTAAAVASFAYREAVAVVDGNVYRVLSRLAGITADITTHAAKKLFAALAAELIPADQPDLYNQAIMEFGALLCTPKSPDCLLCPFNSVCVAYLSGRPEAYPVKKGKVASRERFFTYTVFKHQGKLALRERTAKDIWQNLYDFHLEEAPAFENERSERNVVEEPAVSYSPVLQHQLSHQTVFARFRLVEVLDPTAVEALGLRWFSAEEIADLPKSALIVKYLQKHFF